MSTALKNSLKEVKNTPGTKRARADQVQNNAGGYVFAASDKSRLERFLILGTDGGTYYVGESKLTDQNIAFLRKMIKSDERGVVDTIVEVSTEGRALRQSPSLYALALVLSEGEDKAYAREAFNKVVRTSTHLFEVAEYIDGLGGWGRAKRSAVAGWYESKDAVQLGYQAVKYRQRNGWTHRDVLRLSHAKPAESVAQFMLGKEITEMNGSPVILTGFADIQAAESVDDVLRVLNKDMYKNLPWETIPTQFLNEVEVWKTLFANGQLKGQALVRNITRLAKIGAFQDLVFAREYADALTNEEMIAKTRLHPINYLNAAVVYSDGQVPRGSAGMWGYGRSKSWTTESTIKDALNEGFHLAFKHVEPANKRTMVATDISGSMSSNAIGLDLSCAQVSAAVSMQVARTEPYSMIRGFSTSLIDLGISAKDDLSSAMGKVQRYNFGGTDASAAIIWAQDNKVDIDTFVVVTDNETWASEHRQPFQALKQYRQARGIDARLAVLGVASTGFTIADPTDRGMMDFVGFDSNAPKVLADFSAGRI